MEQTIFILLMLLLTYNTKETEIERCYEVPKHNNELLYSSLWAEARGIRYDEEIKIVLDCYRNRVNRKEWPSTLDSVILQPNQFELSKDTISSQFKTLVDSLITLPIEYPYTYFINFKTLKKKQKWMLNKKWIKLGKHHYSE